MKLLIGAIFWLIYTIEFFMFLIIGRLILFFFIRNKDNAMLAFFIKFTDPVMKATRKILPFVKESLVPFVSVLMLYVLSVILKLIKLKLAQQINP